MKKLLAMAALVLATQVGVAQTATKRLPTATAQDTAKVTATVVAIDRTNRTVTLKGTGGRVVELTVGDDVGNFEQLKLGDIVTAEYKRAWSLTMKRHGGSFASEQVTVNRSPEGAKPGGTAEREVAVLADVVAVNAAAQTITLKGPAGNMVDVLVDNPEVLETFHKGDHVQAVYKQALAISVVPADQKK